MAGGRWGCVCAVCGGGGFQPGGASLPALQQTASAASQPPTPASIETAASIESAQALVARTCVGCHNDRARSGNLSLQSFDVATAGEHAETTEKMIRKLRAGQMPPPGSRRPAEAALDALADLLEAQADARAAGAGAGPAHVPAAESRRVRAVDPRSARARRQRRRLPAARREERQLRQHRRRAAAVADADAGRI